MMTSRAEYRLLLRQDNADLRLSEIGYQVGLVPEETYKKVKEKEKQIEEEIKRLNKTVVGASESISNLLKQYGSTPLKTGTTLAELIRRPELDYKKIKEIDKDRKPLPEDIITQVDINIKYEGYIKRQLKQVEQFKKLENKKLSVDFDYNMVENLRKEARQKLNFYKPLSIGQASRISGVSPADISVLLIYLEQLRYRKE